MVGKLSAIADARIEGRARRIDDPVERLRYLRQATARKRSLWPCSQPLLFLLLLALTVPLCSDAVSRAPADDAADLRWSPPAPPARTGDAPRKVWAVERSGSHEVYSNGLRIENELAVETEPRSYHLLTVDDEAAAGPISKEPAGIVFHTTESDQAPFEPGHNAALNRIGRELLLYVREKRAYHFVIDRFGRVNRIVAESGRANHAGRSVWADSSWAYTDLNSSFLGVAFEARTQPDQDSINAAQLHAGAVLTEMLRGKYNIPAEDCVTHAQVSVNPENMRIGWHTDWGTSFPFSGMGLPNNYERPNPGLYLFGFEYDAAYIHSTNPDLWKGLALAEARLRALAAGRRVSVAQYRALLGRKYRSLSSALRNSSAAVEN